MGKIFQDLIAEILSSLLNEIDSVLVLLLDGMLRIENLVDSISSLAITNDTITTVYMFTYALAFSLVILKFLNKGFKVYILWRDGDSDASPQDMLMGSIMAVVVSMCFPYLYELMSRITRWFAEGIMFRFGVDVSGDSISRFPDLTSLSLGIVIFLAVYVIMLLVMSISLLRRGAELLVLRLGIPISTLGLIDSDMGLFKGYIQTLFKALFTSVIQITLLSLSLRIVMSFDFLGIILGIVFLTTAMATPTLMQQVLVSGGHGGGITNKVYTASMAARALRGLVGR